MLAPWVSVEPSQLTITLVASSPVPMLTEGVGPLSGTVAAVTDVKLDKTREDP